ncbi:MAG: alpha/beta hydrolase [Acidimicrobiales bacterium]
MSTPAAFPQSLRFHEGGPLDTASRRVRAAAERVARSPRLPSVAIGAFAAGTALGWGVLTGWLTPRGPLTTSAALTSIVVSVAVGVLAGAALRSRWAILAAPVAFAIGVEVTRLGVDGPTVDGIHTSEYGLIALVVGRGFHALVALVPLALGATFGAALARRLLTRGEAFDTPSRKIALWTRRGVATAAAIALTTLAVGLARPAQTDAITGPDGEKVAGSIAELTSVEIGGHDLAMMIRGHDADAPVLLFLAGGPGGSEMGAMRNHLPELEEHFVVVTWDQRGTGKSYTELDPTSTLTLEGAVSDTIEVTEYLRDRFDRDRIHLVGQSWGSILGVLAAQQHPEMYASFTGTGQMVSPLETDTIFWEDTLAWARANGDDGLVEELTSIGPPPYENFLHYETALSHEHEVYPYDHSQNSEGEGGFSENLLEEEYTLTEQVHLLGAFMDTFTTLYPQIQHIDFRLDAPSLDVPVFFAQGTHEADGRAEPFAQWYEMLDAPVKELVVLDTSGHRPLFEQPDEFVDFMVDVVLPATGGGGDT